MAGQITRAFLALAAIVASVATVLSSQETGASVSGRVVDAVTGRPIEGAQVLLGPYGGRIDQSLSAISDAGGQFVFKGLLAGSKRLTSKAQGYLQGSAGAAAAWEGVTAAIEIKENEQRSGVIIRMWRSAVMSGTVRTPNGNPIVGATVAALRRVQTCGADRLDAGLTARTDDRGQYRISDLTPGDYMIAVRGSASLTVFPPKDSVVFPTAYHPGNVHPMSQNFIAVAAGDELLNIDVTRPAGGVTVRGRLLEPDGSPSTRRIDVMLPDNGLRSEWEVTRAFPASDVSDLATRGSFKFGPVPAGRYVLRVVSFPPADRLAVTQRSFGFQMVSDRPNGEWPPTPDAPTIWGDLPVDVGDRDLDVTFNLQYGWRIRGHVTVDGVPLTDSRRIPVFILTFRSDAADGDGMQAARVEADGSFTTVAVPTGRYRLAAVPNAPSPATASMPPALTTAAVRVGGKDTGWLPIDVFGADVSDVTIDFTEKPSDIAGTVELDDDLKSWGGRVYIFPVNERTWSLCGMSYGFGFAAVPWRSDGTFLARVPPGEYFAAAMGGSEMYWQRPDFLRPLVPFAARVKVEKGDHAKINVKARPRK